MPEEHEGKLLDEVIPNETLEITLNRETNEIFLRNPKDDHIVKLSSKFKDIIEEKFEELEDYEERRKIPILSPKEFEDGIKQLNELGLTFSVDLFPSIIAKDESSPDIIDSSKFDSIREKYPALPREVGLVAHNTLTGEKHGVDVIGGDESYEQKSKIVEEFVLTPQYKTDFFFKHALKVPYLENIDWEVILKTHEKGVKGVVSVPYAMLMLTFHNTNPKIGELDVHKNITVAVNAEIIDRMLGTFTEVRASLKESSELAALIRANS